MQQVRSFLQQNNLRAWIAWRPDELLMLSGYIPFWGASFLIYFADAEPLLFVPQIEPRDHIPTGPRVQDYPWGDLKCSDPYAVLVSTMGSVLAKTKAKPEDVGMNPSTSRTSLPIQAAEQIPIPEDFAKQLSVLTAKPDGRHQAAFADLYLRKTAEEIEAIRLANRVANVGLDAFFANLQPGVPEADVAAAVESAIYRQIGTDGIFHSRGWAMVQSGPNSALAGRFNRSTGRRLQNGDLVLIELATCVNGYWSDLTRTAPLARRSLKLWKFSPSSQMRNKPRSMACAAVCPLHSSMHWRGTKLQRKDSRRSSPTTPAIMLASATMIRDS